MKKTYSEPQLKKLSNIKNLTKAAPDPGKSGTPNDSNSHSS